jgi:hypothetical protein
LFGRPLACAGSGAARGRQPTRGLALASGYAEQGVDGLRGARGAAGPMRITSKPSTLRLIAVNRDFSAGPSSDDRSRNVSSMTEGASAYLFSALPRSTTARRLDGHGR